MANSRLEKLGTIFSRVTSLMKCGAISPKDKPLWYEVYQAFPPIDDPSYSRRVPIKEVKPIFYPEDRIRAKFHRGNYVSRIMIESLEGVVTPNDVTQKVILSTVNILKEEPHLSEDNAIKKAIDKFLSERALEDEKPRSIFKSQYRKTSHITKSVDMVNIPKKVDSRELKNIAQKDVNVDINLSRQFEDDDVTIEDDGSHYKRDSIVDDFKNACKNASPQKLVKDDSSEEK